MGGFLKGVADVLASPVTKISDALGIKGNPLADMEHPGELIFGKSSGLGQTLDHPIDAVVRATSKPDVPPVPEAPPIPTVTDPEVVTAQGTASQQARSKRGRAANYLMGSSGSNSLLGTSGGFFQPALGG